MEIPQMIPWLGEEEAAAAAEAVRSNWITEGPRSAQFIEKLNALTGSPYGVLAPNGTLALALGLMALEIGPGDEVIVPDISFIASATAVAMVGATPVFADVDPQTYQIDVDACDVALSPRTRAVMPVHLYGLAADMHAVMRFAADHDLKVIEDAAQAIGVTFNGRHAGTFGDVGCFSFFADKTITTGEGGYVACHSPRVFERLRLLRNQGRLDRGAFIHPAVGYNFRMTDIQSAIGLVQLAKLEQIIRRKTAILRGYQQRLGNLPSVQFLTAPPGSSQVPFRVVLFHDRAHDLMAHLGREGVQNRTFFYPLHKQPPFAEQTDDRRYPHANRGYRRGVCLPVYPALGEQELDYICQCVRGFAG